ncbi:hypothetical protein A3D11_00740 [Candidatus Peribacteria bacterium RIFCSPHIGHO2_02_FULL_49_16]|nr:MAG: hypothetical protein A2880_01395 [Candidatus Peribacteria bacterium RIFCSPHIGHO2_01_FULL_49_38]OGJ60056.1 MAG: hypothetical protein A3D11_00740 [Candidatus Peribacteria bacterium RIFCSPHIGHO2_02_FULL_49_16]
MPKHPTTIRIEQNLYRETVREAEKIGLNFTSVVHLLLYAFMEGTVQIGVTQHPPEYLAALGKEADSLRHQHRKGKAKRYASSKALFDDILDR